MLGMRNTYRNLIAGWKDDSNGRFSQRRNCKVK